MVIFNSYVNVYQRVPISTYRILPSHQTVSGLPKPRFLSNDLLRTWGPWASHSWHSCQLFETPMDHEHHLISLDSIEKSKSAIQRYPKCMMHHDAWKTSPCAWQPRCWSTTLWVCRSDRSWPYNLINLGHICHGPGNSSWHKRHNLWFNRFQPPPPKWNRFRMVPASPSTTQLATQQRFPQRSSSTSPGKYHELPSIT